MNKKRRAEIERAIALLEEAKEIFETAGQEEREYYDNMPESFQNGERGEAADAAASALEEACQTIETAIDGANEAIQ